MEKNQRCKRKRSQMVRFLLVVCCCSLYYCFIWLQMNDGDKKKESTNDVDKTNSTTTPSIPLLSADTTTTMTTPHSSSTSSASLLSSSSSSSFPSSCQRRCYDYRNKVLIRPHSREGLLDRLYVIQTMLNVAGYLCAQLYVPRPKFLLNDQKHHHHNHPSGAGPYQGIHDNIQWSDFFLFSNLTVISQQQQNDNGISGSSLFFQQKRQSVMEEQRQQQQQPLVDWLDERNWTRYSPRIKTSSFREKEAYRNWLLIDTRSVENAWTDFLLMEEHSFATQLSLLQRQQQQVPSSSSSSLWHDEESFKNHTNNETTGFIWQLSAKFYDSMDQLALGLEQRRQHQQDHLIPSSVQQWMQSQQQYTTPFMTMMINDSNKKHINNSNDRNTTTMTEVETSSVDQWWRRMQPDLILQLDDFYHTNNNHSSSLIPVSLQTTRGCTYFQMNTPHALQLLRDEVFRIVTTRQWHNYTILSSSNKDNSTTRTSQPSGIDAQTVSSSLSSLPPVVGYFHLRRNDATVFCDTPLEKIESYLSCSLPKALSHLSSSSLSSSTTSMPAVPEVRFVIILLSSDETDEQYRRAVLQLIERQQQKQLNGHHLVRVVAMDLDDIVRHVVEQGVAKGTIPSWLYNQFYLFQCNLAVRDDPRIQIRLFQRRVFCPACTNVTQQLLKQRIS